MPRHTSLPSLGKEYYLKMFPCLTRALNGDSCASAIISVIDFLTANKLEELDAAGEEEGLLWITITMTKLKEYMDDLYSVRRIQERIETLVGIGILLVPSEQDLYTHKPSAKMRFLLNREAAEALISSGKPLRLNPVTNVTAVTNVTDPVTNVTETVTKEHCYIGRDSSLDSFLDNTPKSPLALTGSFSDEDQDDNIQEILDASDRNRAIRKKQQQLVKEAKREQKHSSNREYCERNRRLRETADSRLSGESGGILPAPPPPTIAPASPVLQGGPSCIESWNANFPDSAIDPGIYSNGSMPWPLRDGSLQSQMGSVIAKVRSMRERGAEVSFGDLLKAEKGGGYRWQAILAGSWDWLCKSKKPTETLGERKAREAHDKLEALKRARTQNTGIPGDDVSHAGIPHNRPGN